MDASTWMSVFSLVVAGAAVAVSTVLTYRHVRISSNANEIEAIASIFQEIRSTPFRKHFDAVIAWSEKYKQDRCLADLSDGFASLDEHLRESAYTVSYFFEHIGVLVEQGLVPGETLMSTMCTPMIRSWDALEPAIAAEKAYRQQAFDRRIGADFLPHFRAMVERVEQGRAGSGSGRVQG